MTRSQPPATWSPRPGYARPPASPAPAPRKARRPGQHLAAYSLGQAATGAACTTSFLGERYHRIARRRGKAKAQVAVARSILVITWHLLSDPAARFTDLGPGYYQARTDKDKKIRTTSADRGAAGPPHHHHPGRVTSHCP